MGCDTGLERPFRLSSGDFRHNGRNDSELFYVEKRTTDGIWSRSVCLGSLSLIPIGLTLFKGETDETAEYNGKAI